MENKCKEMSLARPIIAFPPVALSLRHKWAGGGKGGGGAPMNHPKLPGPGGYIVLRGYSWPRVSEQSSV